MPTLNKKTPSSLSLSQRIVYSTLQKKCIIKFSDDIYRSNTTDNIQSFAIQEAIQTLHFNKTITTDTNFYPLYTSPFPKENRIKLLITHKDKTFVTFSEDSHVSRYERKLSFQHDTIDSSHALP